MFSRLGALALLLCACSTRKDPAQMFADAAPPVVSAPVVVIPPVDAGPSPAKRADLDRANGWLADLQFLLANNETTSRHLASGEGDATAICDAAMAVRLKTTDAEIAQLIDQSLALCSFDVPLLVANEALDHLRTSTSQASVRLMCEVSAKEIAKAKAVRPKDPKVARAIGRRNASGRCH